MTSAAPGPGDYVREGGIRLYPYSFDMAVNPATFSYLSDPRYTGVHAIGSVWCGILHDVFWAMRAEYDFDPDWYDGVRGNNVGAQKNDLLWQVFTIKRTGAALKEVPPDGLAIKGVPLGILLLRMRAQRYGMAVRRMPRRCDTF